MTPDALPAPPAALVVCKGEKWKRKVMSYSWRGAREGGGGRGEGRSERRGGDSRLAWGGRLARTAPFPPDGSHDRPDGDRHPSRAAALRAGRAPRGATAAGPRSGSFTGYIPTLPRIGSQSALFRRAKSPCGPVRADFRARTDSRRHYELGLYEWRVFLDHDHEDDEFLMEKGELSGMSMRRYTFPNTDLHFLCDAEGAGSHDRPTARPWPAGSPCRAAAVVGRACTAGGPARGQWPPGLFTSRRPATAASQRRRHAIAAASRGRARGRTAGGGWDGRAPRPRDATGAARRPRRRGLRASTPTPPSPSTDSPPTWVTATGRGKPHRGRGATARTRTLSTAGGHTVGLETRCTCTSPIPLLSPAADLRGRAPRSVRGALAAAAVASAFPLACKPHANGVRGAPRNGV